MPEEANIEISLLRAMVALLIDQRESRLGGEQSVRTEVLLADAGLTAAEVAQLTGRNAPAVRMILSRARRAKG